MAKRQEPSKAERKAIAKAAKQAEDERNKGRQMWKLLGTGTAIATGMLTARALDATWRTATGHPPPTKPEHPDIGGREAIAWAAISGLAIGVAKTYAIRRAARYWVKSTGRLPPGMSPEAYAQVEESIS